MDQVIQKLQALKCPGYAVRNCAGCRALLYARHPMCRACFEAALTPDRCHAAGVVVVAQVDGAAHVLLGRCTARKGPHRVGGLEVLGGVAEPGETPAETAARELREETLGALAPAPGELRLAAAYKNGAGRGYLAFVYELPAAAARAAIAEFGARLLQQGGGCGALMGCDDDEIFSPDECERQRDALEIDALELVPAAAVRAGRRTRGANWVLPFAQLLVSRALPVPTRGARDENDIVAGTGPIVAGTGSMVAGNESIAVRCRPARDKL